MSEAVTCNKVHVSSRPRGRTAGVGEDGSSKRVFATAPRSSVFRVPLHTEFSSELVVHLRRVHDARRASAQSPARVSHARPERTAESEGAGPRIGRVQYDEKPRAYCRAMPHERSGGSWSRGNLAGREGADLATPLHSLLFAGTGLPWIESLQKTLNRYVVCPSHLLVPHSPRSSSSSLLDTPSRCTPLYSLLGLSVSPDPPRESTTAPSSSSRTYSHSTRSPRLDLSTFTLSQKTPRSRWASSRRSRTSSSRCVCRACTAGPVDGPLHRLLLNRFRTCLPLTLSSLTCADLADAEEQVSLCSCLAERATVDAQKLIIGNAFFLPLRRATEYHLGLVRPPSLP